MALPSDDTDLENLFTAGEYTQVSLDDADRVSQTAPGQYAVFLFKDKNTNNEDSISVQWNGQSDLAPSQSTIYLQIYNQTLMQWETLDSDNATEANNDFNLEGSVIADVANYYGMNNWVACRVYQNANG